MRLSEQAKKKKTLNKLQIAVTFFSSSFVDGECRLAYVRARERILLQRIISTTFYSVDFQRERVRLF